MRGTVGDRIAEREIGGVGAVAEERERAEEDGAGGECGQEVARRAMSMRWSASGRAMANAASGR